MPKSNFNPIAPARQLPNAAAAGKAISDASGRLGRYLFGGQWARDRTRRNQENARWRSKLK